MMLLIHYFGSERAIPRRTAICRWWVAYKSSTPIRRERPGDARRAGSVAALQVGAMVTADVNNSILGVATLCDISSNLNVGLTFSYI